MKTVKTEYFASPLEPLFFGNPTPFNAGESRYSRSMFPPSPMTFQGIIRSHLLRCVSPPLNLDDWSKQARNERAAIVGDSNSLLHEWQLKGPLPAIAEKAQDSTEADSLVLSPWVPVPRFLFQNGPAASTAVKGSLLNSNQPFLDDRDIHVLEHPELHINYGTKLPEQFRPAQGWIDTETLWWALSGNKDPWPHGKKLLSLPPFIKATQTQPGIALDRKSNTAIDGMLYLLEHLRFAPNSGFWGSFSGSLDDRISDAPLATGLGSAGRKGRLMAFTSPQESNGTWHDLLAGKHLPESPEGKEYYWLYLLSPAGMEPPGTADSNAFFLPGNVRISPEKLEGTVVIWNGKESEPEGAYIRCVSAIIGSPLILGGMDMARGTTRPNHSFLPPGSAWLLEVKGTTESHCRQILNALNNSHLLGDPRQACFGFGHTLVGIGPEKKESIHDH